MQNFESLPITQLIRPEGFECECGTPHSVQVEYIKIERGALMRVADAVRALGARKPYIVCDANTYAAAGKRVTELLAAAGIPHALCVIPHAGADKLEPDERALGSIAMRFDPECDLILGVGSGVINDLCKVFAHSARLKQMIVGTAPSMDGFASNSSSMIVDGVKCTLYNRCPAAILLDADVLARAPMRMLQAGLGDMAAKYISLCEWRISNIVTGEYYCERVAELMRASLKKVMAAADKLPERDPDAVKAVAEGLVMSGFAMSFARVSRPASGLEHYFSHIWEMVALSRGEASDLHGIQVGVGTLITMRIYDWIRALKPDRAKAEAAMRAFNANEWEARVKRVFGKTAPNVLDIERATHKNDPARQAARLTAILDNWRGIQAIISEELPDGEWLTARLRASGMPMSPKELGIPRADVVDAFTCARDIRDKYMSVSMLWDLGELDDFARRLSEEFA